MQNVTNANTSTDKPLSEDLKTASDFAREYTDLFPEGRVKWLLDTRHRNGLSEMGAVLKISGRLYIRVSKFFDWVATQSEG